MPDDVTIDAYPFRATDKVRYRDTDRQGHVNNAVFATFLETGRVELLVSRLRPLTGPGKSLVLARLAVDYRREITWPGSVVIGTRIEKVGRSSITLAQALFQGDACVAIAETVVVLMDEATRRSHPLPQEAVAWLRTTGGEPPGA
jgi:acyl-CoA thioester hydrolase